MPRKKSDLKKISIYLFPDMWNRCAALASLERVPAAIIFRRAIDEYIERQTGEKQKH